MDQPHIDHVDQPHDDGREGAQGAGSSAPSGIGRPLGAATYTFLYATGIDGALRALADAGIGLVELTAAPPHVDACAMARDEVRRLRRLVDALGLQVISLNPTYLDINLVSLNSPMREESTRQLESALHLCSDLEIGMLVLFAGRRHPLAPAPRSLVEPVLLEQIARLLGVATELGVTIGLENGPTLVLDRAEEVAEVCRTLGSPGLVAVFDAANAQMVEEPARGLAHLLPHLGLVHLSDTSAAKWAHAPVGRGDVAFSAVAAVLDDAQYRGPSIMEIVDLEHPLEALVSSAEALRALGWATVAPVPVAHEAESTG